MYSSTNKRLTVMINKNVSGKVEVLITRYPTNVDGSFYSNYRLSRPTMFYMWCGFLNFMLGSGSSETEIGLAKVNNMRLY